MLILTYDNTHCQDGFGAQYQRILGIYSICKEFNILYYHSGFNNIDYQGLNSLVKNERSVEFVKNFNDRINIPSDIKKLSLYKNLKVQRGELTFELLNNLLEKSKKENILFKVTLPYKICDNYIDIYKHCKNLYKTEIKKNNIFTIGVHIRRGELYVVDSWRMLPNSYYIEKINTVTKILQEKNINYIIELYTEIPEEKTVITGKHVGINNRIKDNIIIDPDSNKIEDFNNIPNLEKYINEDINITFDRMINCDILITSRSSLSACASYIKNGISLYYPFWHKLLTKDINSIDINHNKLLEEYITKCALNT